MALHVAVVDCESPDLILQGYGTQGDIIERLLSRNLGVDSCQPAHLKISKWNAHQTLIYPTLDDVDSLFLTGGGTSPRLPKSRIVILTGVFRLQCVR